MNLLDPLTTAVFLVLLGLLLAVSEVFFPSGGMLGFFSLVSLAGSIWYAYQWGGAGTGLSFAIVVLVLVPVLVGYALKVLPSTPIGRALIGAPVRAEDVAVIDDRRSLVGKVGVARSKMLPSGAVEVDGRMVDCVTQGQAIEPGEYVKVVEVRGNRVVVRAARGDERPTRPQGGDLLSKPIEELGIDPIDPLA